MRQDDRPAWWEPLLVWASYLAVVWLGMHTVR
jgi:hypothetical protein